VGAGVNECFFIGSAALMTHKRLMHFSGLSSYGSVNTGNMQP
jgi:hypothetical protein